MICILKFVWKCVVISIKKIWRFLTHKETPVGVTLFLFCVTAWGTYFLSPKLNETFEKQKIVSAYVTKNLNDFNTLSRELISEISVFTNELDARGTVN